MEANTLVVGDQVYTVDSETEVYDQYGMIMSYYELEVGMKVEVRDNIKDGELYADRVQVMSAVSDVETRSAPLDISVTSYPNPFTSTAKLKFNLPASADVSVKVYDQSGSQMMELHSGYLNAGSHEFEVNTNDELSAGVYFARIVINGKVFSKTMVKTD